MELNQEVVDSLQFSLQELVVDHEESQEENEYCEIVATTLNINGKDCQVTVKLIINPGLFLTEDQIYYLNSQPSSEKEEEDD